MQSVKAKKPTGRALRDQLIRRSSMNIRAAFDWTGALSGLILEIRGDLAEIPSLKNSKIPGTNFINPLTVARLKALGSLFTAAWFDEFATADRKLALPATFGKEELFAVLICGKRGRRFDTDNAFAAIRDWCEPPAKLNRKHTRGWGVGIVADDSQISGLAINETDLGYSTGRTIFILARLADARPGLAAFVASEFMRIEGAAARPRKKGEK
jgi:hypothetical protein